MIQQNYSNSIDFYLSLCEHNGQLGQSNCQFCGIYLPKSGVKGYKGQMFEHENQMNSQKIYHALFGKSLRSIQSQSQNQDYINNRQLLINYVFQLSNSFGMTPKTGHIAIEYLDHVMSQTQQIKMIKFQMYAACCLLLAAKAQDQARIIPLVSQLKQQGSLLECKEEIQQCEQHILKVLNWNLQCSTNYERIHFLLSQGVVFSSDLIGEEILRSAVLDVIEKFYPEVFLNTEEIQRQKVIDKNVIKMAVMAIEQQSEILSKQVLQDYYLVQLDYKTLSCACIAYLRTKNNVSPYWNDELEEITNVQRSQIFEIYQILNEKFDYNQETDGEFSKPLKPLHFNVDPDVAYPKILMRKSYKYEQQENFQCQINHFKKPQLNTSYVKPSFMNSSIQFKSNLNINTRLSSQNFTSINY